MTDRSLQKALHARFGDAPLPEIPMPSALTVMAERGSCRAFEDRDVPDDLLEVLCAVALAAPTKSDLQQRDIIVLKSSEKRKTLASLVADQAWVAHAPLILIFCGNNRRQRLLHDWAQVPFANDHIDSFLNASADAAIALGAFVTAAEAAGLGCCPISAVRNDALAVSELLRLPKHVFPFAGLALGYPKAKPEISPRLPLHVTCHTDEYQEDGLQSAVAAYDQSRATLQPYASQRYIATFGVSDTYGWSTDKVRQYSVPERADFGTYLISQGFALK